MVCCSMNNNNISFHNAEIERYESLNGLRAYAMICIIIMHVKAFLPYHQARIIGSFSHFVLLFMMISAFSMCCGYYQRIKEGTITPLQFYKRRYFRILPYFAFLCVIALVIEHNLTSLYEFFANVTLCFGLLPNPQIEMMSLGWFLGIIFLFYLLFPFFVFMLDNRRSAWISLILSLLFAFIAIAYFYKPPFVNKSPQMHNIIYCMPFFVMGGIIYLGRKRITDFGMTHTVLITILTLALSVGYFILMASINNVYFIYALELSMYSIWIIYAISTSPKFMDNKLTSFLSRISLEMYLAQMFAFRGVQLLHLENYVSNETWLYVITCILTLAVVIPFTYITKTFIVDKIVDRITVANK